jgi:RNase P subunit RPR2
MQHLRCANCSKILVPDFWDMVDGETVRTFSSFTLTCDCCGAMVQVVPMRRPRWMRLADARPYLAAVTP